MGCTVHLSRMGGEVNVWVRVFPQDAAGCCVLIYHCATVVISMSQGPIRAFYPRAPAMLMRININCTWLFDARCGQ